MAFNDVTRAANILRAGDLVAFATETVYGLGADARNPAAVAKIFDAKGRPPTNPLIVHVLDANAARGYAAAWTDSADRLTGAFWPGPLTIVLGRGSSIAPAVSAGLSTVALRSPDHPLALELLRVFAGPIAAPSANRSTRVSPTTAEHVRAELGDRVDLILDGGPCRFGIESTVLDLTRPRPMILRPGSVSREAIEAQIGAVDLFQGSISQAEAAVSPGQQAIHYAPATPAWRFFPRQWTEVAHAASANPGSWAILQLRSNPERDSRKNDSFIQVIDLAGEDDPASYASGLYAALRTLDGVGAAAIMVEMPPDQPRWLAVRDRLKRATRPWPATG